MRKINKLAVRMINDYQASHNANTIPRCKYYPTCSEYSKQCYMNYNVFLATILTIWRILRCNPFSRGGYDPIPKVKKEWKKMKKMEKLKEIQDVQEKSYLDKDL